MAASTLVGVLYMKRFAPWAMLLLLVGCGQDQVSPTVVANTKTVAVISSVGDQLTISGIALISLGNVWDRGEIPQWGIDRHIVDLLTEKLRAHYQVVPVTYAPADFHYDILSAPLESWSGQPIGKVIRTKTSLKDSSGSGGSASAPPASVDLYVAIVPSSNYYFHANGLAFYRQYGQSSDLYEMTASYFVDVIDGHTFKVIAVVDGTAEQFADATLWSDTVAGLTPAQQQQLAKIGADMFDGPLTTALQQLKLIP